MNNIASFPARTKTDAPRLAGCCIVRHCGEEIDIADSFCPRHAAMVTLAQLAEMFIAWEDFLLAVHASRVADAHDALHRYLKAQRAARLGVEALEAGHAAHG